MFRSDFKILTELHVFRAGLVSILHLFVFVHLCFGKFVQAAALTSFPRIKWQNSLRLKMSYPRILFLLMMLNGVAPASVALHLEESDLDCDFEHGMCGWENYYDFSGPQMLDFEFGTAATLPSLDDSVDRGVFLYVPVHDATPSGTWSILRHDPVEGNEPSSVCLQFDYLITEEHVGDLTVWLYNLIDAANEWNYTLVWSSLGQNNFGTWQKGQIYLDTGAVWTLLLEAIVNEQNQPLSDRLHGIAIDNIQHTLVSSADKCPKLPHLAATSTTNPITILSNPIVQSCSFDVDFCGWTVASAVSLSTVIRWIRAHQTFTDGDDAWIVPYRTENTQSDFFLFADVSADADDDRQGTIKTPWVFVADNSLPVDYCIRFWMYFETDEVAEIIVTRNGNDLVRYRGNATDVWMENVISFRTTGSYQIAFQARSRARGASSPYFAAVAIDEYELRRGECSNDVLTDSGTYPASIAENTLTTVPQLLTTPSPDEKTTSAPETCVPANEPAPIDCHCQKGFIDMDETDFQTTEAVEAVFIADSTYLCRKHLRDLHFWLLRTAGATGRSGAPALPTRITCSKGQFSVGDEDPDVVESGELVFRAASVDLQCRTVFVQFLKRMAALAKK
ncbi:MAM and LDL-receptor class A domain-containing protein 1-like isoform X2 [Paramacrobiotus metropolitanus]|uniref:MAM and LDL-receptor class A domain-containing protein 1-like isoform X2 n=1 Tax=Paramacrobiotus metropolitanus TaxID=2943436 RepID=UPI0024461911|nr:MAM and LDL-receptor class A domain-containing protein 1-like isoform X2 [Paramacrobiotus metropolitanus]